MRLTYHELVGTQVADSEGRKVGRVADLRAKNVKGRLRVTGLLVGERELLARLGLRIGAIVGETGLPGYFIPWTMIASVGKTIKLRVTLESLERLPNVTRPFIKS